MRSNDERMYSQKASRKAAKNALPVEMRGNYRLAIVAEVRIAKLTAQKVTSLNRTH